MTIFRHRLVVAFLMLLAAVFALTVIMDPYDFWGTPRIAGLNAFRPEANTQLVLMKARQFARARARTIIAGNSRVQVGFDPNSQAWPARMRPVYNYGMPGMTFPGLVANLERALAARPPATLIVGLYLLDFRVSQAQWRAWRPADAAPPRTLATRVGDIAQVSFSLPALADSLTEFAEQHRRHPRDVTALGFEAPGGYEGIAATDGEATLFAQRNRENYSNYRTGPKAVRWPGPGGSDAWAALDHLERTARAKGVRMILFTYPYHADILVGLDRAGLLPALLDFRRAVAAFAAARGVEARNFTEVNAFTTERVPAPGDLRTRTRWYWEAGHFKAALGDQLLARLRPTFGDPKPIVSGLNARGSARYDGSSETWTSGGSLDPALIDAANVALSARIKALTTDPARARRLPPDLALAGR